MIAYLKQWRREELNNNMSAPEIAKVESQNISEIRIIIPVLKDKAVTVMHLCLCLFY